jgi:hypothetical protein
MRSALDNYDAAALEHKNDPHNAFAEFSYKVGIALFLVLMLMAVITLFAPAS